ncbi:butyrophilin subfamily 2 member A1-like isoform X2 [Channa argus]|uniref:butyrophilin subfamily 2 member A1-like isoform X2 n=1 Tax=Channa argus TaxID=215402 RepID=UPI003522E826
MSSVIRLIFLTMCWARVLLVTSSSLLAVAFPIQRIEAEEGQNLSLQCLLGPHVNVSGSTVEWSKDGHANIVHLYIDGRDRAVDQKEEFKNRTTLFHEGLNTGNVTLQLSSVQLSDNGTYRCYIISLKTYCYTVLTVVKKGQINRSWGNHSNRTTASLDEVPQPNNPDLNVWYTVGGIILSIVMILGIIWIYKTFQGWRGRRTERTAKCFGPMEEMGVNICPVV